MAEILAFADEHRVNVIPRTGATATEGGLESVVADSIVLDGSAMDQILSIDACNMQATAQCGVPLQVLEDRAREQGLTTGHSPQSKPVAHMGGLVPPAASASSRRSTAASRTWSWASRPSSPAAK